MCLFLGTNSYNIAVAKIFGVCSAVFLSCLNYEGEYQLRQSTKDLSSISLSRDEIFERTGLDFDKQREVENALSECGILRMESYRNNKDKNRYDINMSTLQRVLVSTNPVGELITEAAKNTIVVNNRHKTKKQLHIDNLKKQINCEDDLMRQYWIDWIDSVYTNPRGFLSKESVNIAQQELFSYTSDREKQIDIIKIAIKGGYRDITWAIQSFEKNVKVRDAVNFANYADIKSDGSNLANEVF